MRMLAMQLRPLGWKVYVTMDDAEDGVNVNEALAAMGFEIRRGMDEQEIRRSIASEDVGTIVAIGPHAWMRSDLQGGRERGQWEQWAKVGDRVIFGRNAGKLVRDRELGQWLMMVNDEDIQSVIEKPDFTAIEQELDQLEIGE